MVSRAGDGVVKPWISLKYFVYFFLALWTFLAVILYLITEAERSHLLETAVEQQKSVIEKNLVTFEQAFVHAKHDINYLAGLAEVKSYATGLSSRQIQKIELSLGHFLETHLEYDHIRFIDLNGYEVARVNQISGGIYHVPKSELQHKGDSSYFLESQSFTEGQVYISEFDLNRENGVVEPSLKRVIRFVVNVFNLQGQKVGSIVANLRGNHFLNEMETNALSRGMQGAFFRVNSAENYTRIDSSIEFSSLMPSLIKSMRLSKERWGTLLLNEQLYSYYWFSPTHLSFESLNLENTLNASTQFPWLFIVRLSEKEVTSKLLIHSVNPWPFWGFLNLFVLVLSLLFAYLRSSQARFERMLERQVSLFDGFFKNTPSAYLIKDLNGRVIYFNEVARALFGKGDDLYNSTFLELGLINAGKFSEVEGGVVESKQPQAFETEINNTQLHVTIFPIVNAKNEIIMIGSIAADQSRSLKRAKQSLRKKTQLLEAISHTQNQFMNSESREGSFECLLSSVMSLTKSKCGFIAEIESGADNPLLIRPDAVSNLSWNDEYQTLYKIEDGNELELHDMIDLFMTVIDSQQAVIINDMKKALAFSDTTEGQATLSRFLGLPIFYQNEVIGIIGLANSAEQYNYAVIEFISPLLELYGQMIHIKRVQRESQSIAKQLAQKEHWLSMVIDTAPDGILLLDRGGEILLANQAVNELFDYAEGELVSREVGVLLSDRLRIDSVKILSTEQNISGRVIEAVSKNGEIIPVEIRVSSAIKEKSEVYAVCIVRDIRARLETEKQLRQSQKMDAIGQLTGGIAHDFNNLLGIIQGNLDLACLSIQDDDSQTALQDVGKAQEATVRSAKLIQRLLAFARKQPLTPKVISLEETVNEALSLLEHALGSNIKLHTQFALDTGMVKLDKQQFENALINLAVNARDAMGGEGEFSISVSNQVVGNKTNCIGGDEIQPGHYVLVAVEDTGHGLTEEQKTRIFEPFYTSKKMGKGTGLGLAMVYGFIRQSKGFIQVESQLDSGTVFKLYLPESSAIKQVEPVIDNALGNVKETVKLLVVDDEKSLLDSSSKLLKHAGYEVVVAESAEQALEILKHQLFDLVFTDVVMQGELNGIDLVLQAHEQYPNLKFVIGTGYSERLLDSPELEWLRECLILKPYREAELLKIISHSLEKKPH